MTGEESFENLLVRAGKGDEAAWQPIVAELGPLVRGYLRAVGDPEPDHELLAIFEEIAADIDSYQGRIEEFVTYLFDIAITRQNQRRDQGPADDATAYAAPGARLDPTIRDAVLLKRLAKLEPAEIGYILNTSPEQVQRWQLQGEREIADDQWGTR